MDKDEKQLREAHAKNIRDISKLWHGYTSVKEIRYLLYLNDVALENELKKLREVNKNENS